MTAKDYAALIAAAKAHIDHGFSRAGRAFKPEDARARLAALLSGRVISMADALALLALRHHANEGLPILCSLMEAAKRLRRLAKAGGEKYAEDFWSKSLGLSWQTLLGGDSPLDSSHDPAFARAFEQAQGACKRHFLANWGGIPWSHVFGASPEEAVSPEEVLRLAATAMAEALLALNLMWPGRFEGAQEIFSRAKPDAGGPQD